MHIFKELLIYAIYLSFAVATYPTKYRDVSSLTDEEICWGKYNIQLHLEELPLLIGNYKLCFMNCKNQKNLKKMDKLYYRMVDTEPLVRDSYYMGDIGYRTVMRFLRLLDLVELYRDEFCREHGPGHKRQIVQEVSSIHLLPSASSGIVPLILAAQDTDKIEACAALLGLDNYDDIVNQNESLFIPMPIMGNMSSQKVITLPMFENYSVPLNGDDSANVLVDYYILSMRCLTLTRKQRHAAYLFNVQFLKWIIENVLPHLPEDELHPAFGGVMKILATMKSIGTLKGTDDAQSSNIYKYSGELDKGEIPVEQKGDVPKEVPNSQAQEIYNQPVDISNHRDEAKPNDCSCKHLVLIIVITLVSILMAIVIIRCCYCINKNQKEKIKETPIERPRENQRHRSVEYLEHQNMIGQMAQRLDTLAERIHTLLDLESVTDEELNEEEIRNLGAWSPLGSGDAGSPKIVQR